MSAVRPASRSGGQQTLTPSSPPSSPRPLPPPPLSHHALPCRSAPLPPRRAPSHALTPASLGLFLSHPGCHRLPPTSARLLSRLLSRPCSSPAQAAGFLRAGHLSVQRPLGRARPRPRPPGTTQLLASTRNAAVRPDVAC
uniref:Uncharacterized protein n=1 Tax=Aegilops tauschii TaxID=37682 RepID=M8BNI2_AEGTA